MANPSNSKDLEINPDLVIPAQELSYRRTRSGGPGGQNVNKVNTRVELLFNVEASSVLSRRQKSRIASVLKKKINQEGVLRIVAQEERSQARNLVVARRRLAKLLREVLAVRPKRRPTTPTQGSRKKRLQDKARRSSIKRQRKPVEDDD